MEVEPYTAYLKDDELVGSLSVIGIPEAFSSNISSIQKDELLGKLQCSLMKAQLCVLVFSDILMHLPF